MTNILLLSLRLSVLQSLLEASGGFGDSFVLEGEDTVEEYDEAECISHMA
jgi:hypothetical protein